MSHFPLAHVSSHSLGTGAARVWKCPPTLCAGGWRSWRHRSDEFPGAAIKGMSCVQNQNRTRGGGGRQWHRALVPWVLAALERHRPFACSPHRSARQWSRIKPWLSPGGDKHASTDDNVHQAHPNSGTAFPSHCEPLEEPGPCLSQHHCVSRGLTLPFSISWGRAGASGW